MFEEYKLQLEAWYSYCDCCLKYIIDFMYFILPLSLFLYVVEMANYVFGSFGLLSADIVLLPQLTKCIISVC